jgi:membrane associated rhomboid family serine protease
MNRQKNKPTLAFYLFYPLLIVFLMWLVFFIEDTFNLNFNKYGVYPQTFKGLRGILLSPLIHGGFKHIISNTIPLFVLTGFLFYHYRRIAWQVLFYGWLLTGLLTWLIGRPSYHIGISGINYMLVSFLFFTGVLIGYYRLIALSLIIVFLYGGLIWFMFPIVDHMSWEGHLSGFISGILLAFYYSQKLKPLYQDKKNVKMYPEDETFLSHFDENGNFIESNDK